jgi:hypothetical protein
MPNGADEQRAKTSIENVGEKSKTGLQTTIGVSQSEKIEEDFYKKIESKIDKKVIAFYNFFWIMAVLLILGIVVSVWIDYKNSKRPEIEFINKISDIQAQNILLQKQLENINIGLDDYQYRLTVSEKINEFRLTKYRYPTFQEMQEIKEAVKRLLEIPK